MLLVETKIAPSPISGMGLFADQFIPKGTPVWKFNSKLDIQISKEDFAQLSSVAQRQVLNYCYLNGEKDVYVVCGDDARFFNHADNPNVSSGTDEAIADVALRDIEVGEELTQNYRNFDGNFESKLG